MKRFALLFCLAGCATAPQAAPELRDIRQLTTDGTHAEAYFSYDGKKLVLMAQRAGDKADQIYELDIATKTLTRVSNGQGRTTCGYYLPDGRILYSSTHHHDAEPPAPPDHSKGYVWGLYRSYDIFLREKDGTLKNLTNSAGYDAETTVSPDGKRLACWAPSCHADATTMVVASNAHAAQTGQLSSYAMSVDGSGVRRLTAHDGFDGFPCDSPDGKNLVFISNRNGKDQHKDLNVFIADW